MHPTPEPHRSALMMAAQVGLPGSSERMAAIAAQEKRARKACPDLFIHELRDKHGRLTGYEPASYEAQVHRWDMERKERMSKLLLNRMEAAYVA